MSRSTPSRVTPLRTWSPSGSQRHHLSTVRSSNPTRGGLAGELQRVLHPSRAAGQMHIWIRFEKQVPTAAAFHGVWVVTAFSRQHPPVGLPDGGLFGGQSPRVLGLSVIHESALLRVVTAIASVMPHSDMSSVRILSQTLVDGHLPPVLVDSTRFVLIRGLTGWDEGRWVEGSLIHTLLCWGLFPIPNLHLLSPLT